MGKANTLFNNIGNNYALVNGLDLSWISQEMKDKYSNLDFFDRPLQSKIFKK